MTDKNTAFKKGDLVRKKGDKGQWHGRVCGDYDTDCTPNGIAIESVLEKNSVQIYPKHALEPWDGRLPDYLWQPDWQAVIDAIEDEIVETGTRDVTNTATPIKGD